MSKRPLRALRRIRSSRSSYENFSPILANSFPKSGTHLLTQLLAAVPGSRSYGTFLASMPSLTFRERSRSGTIKAIESIVPGELLGAHLFHDDRYADKLKRRNVSHVFIYRDPRDVVVSESHYLATMNRWHRLHKYFKRLPTLEERIQFSILGSQDSEFRYDYRDVSARFGRYANWLRDPAVCAIRFEDLVGDSRYSVVRSLFEFLRGRMGTDFDLDSTVFQAIKNVDPDRSPTFRRGVVGGWREVMSPRNIDAIKRTAGDLLISLGYETTDDW